MRALLTTGGSDDVVRLGDAPVVEPAHDEVLVEVVAAALNPGEVLGLSGARPDEVPGWEAAGVVVRAAADGSGPLVGSLVTTMGLSGAWAELRAVPATRAALLPSGIDPDVAAALPVAAGSALGALRQLGFLLGTRLLVTGATGAVGRMVVQLAHRAGAEVVASVRDVSASGGVMTGLGAHEVVEGVPEGMEPVDHVIDTVGGDHLVRAFAQLGAHGTLVPLGRASGEPPRFGLTDLQSDPRRPGRAIRTWYLLETARHLSRDLAWLAGEVAAGRLELTVDRVVEAAAVPGLLAEGLSGKTVMRFGSRA